MVPGQSHQGDKLNGAVGGPNIDGWITPLAHEMDIIPLFRTRILRNILQLSTP